MTGPRNKETRLAELETELRENAKAMTGDYLALAPILDDAADAVARVVAAEEALREGKPVIEAAADGKYACAEMGRAWLRKWAAAVPEENKP